MHFFRMNTPYYFERSNTRTGDSVVEGQQLLLTITSAAESAEVAPSVGVNYQDLVTLGLDQDSLCVEGHLY